MIDSLYVNKILMNNPQNVYDLFIICSLSVHKLFSHTTKRRKEETISPILMTPLPSEEHRMHL